MENSNKFFTNEQEFKHIAERLQSLAMHQGYLMQNDIRKAFGLPIIVGYGDMVGFVFENSEEDQSIPDQAWSYVRHEPRTEHASL